MPFLNWFLPRPHLFRSLSGNASLASWVQYFSNSFSTFLTDPLLALLPAAKCYCFAVFYTWSSLFSLQIPHLPSQRVPINYSVLRTFMPTFAGPCEGLVRKPLRLLHCEGCDVTRWVARLHLQANVL